MKSLVMFAALALAGCHRSAPDILVSDGWARATAAGSPAALYLTIHNRGTGTDSMVEVVVPRARFAGLHATTFEGGVMRMRALPDRVDVRAGETVAFAPGRTHIMLTGVAAPLVAGERIKARLRFARSGDKELLVRVEAPGAR